MSPVVQTLNEALEYHMQCTQIRQQVLEQTEAGCPFADAMTSAVQLVDEERARNELPPMKRCYYSVLSTTRGTFVTPTSRVLPTALKFWCVTNRLRGLEPDARVRRWNEEKPSMVAEARAERSEHIARLHRLRRLQRAVAQALRPRREKQQKQKPKQKRQKHNPFQTPAMLKKRWGVKCLPPFIQEVCPLLGPGAEEDEAP